MVQTLDVRQVDQRNLVETDIDHAFLVRAADTREAFMLHGRTGRGLEDAALAGEPAADERHPRAALAAQQRAAKGDGGCLHESSRF